MQVMTRNAKFGRIHHYAYPSWMLFDKEVALKE